MGKELPLAQESSPFAFPAIGGQALASPLFVSFFMFLTCKDIFLTCACECVHACFNIKPFARILVLCLWSVSHVYGHASHLGEVQLQKFWFEFDFVTFCDVPSRFFFPLKS